MSRVLADAITRAATSRAGTRTRLAVTADTVGGVDVGGRIVAVAQWIGMPARAGAPVLLVMQDDGLVGIGDGSATVLLAALEARIAALEEMRSS
jgi:hypothetical protein